MMGSSPPVAVAATSLRHGHAISNLLFSNHRGDHLRFSCKVRLYDASANILKGPSQHTARAVDCCFHDDKSGLNVGAEMSVRRRLVCCAHSSGSDGSDISPDPKDAARKALEQAFGEKKNVFKKWDQEIKRREGMINDGGSGKGWDGGGGGGGGGDDGSDEQESWDWEEAREVFLATSALISLYLLMTLEPKGVYMVIRYFVKYARQGFRRPGVLEDLEGWKARKAKGSIRTRRRKKQISF